ncbi:hypothetical protein VW29_04965 [Devosia limi DSM 17137]|uniref:Uncharacterized protein n=1 Tax=Devosia limi DSM 17137 TaxID=1121477 RepID=A0A0F5LWB9_9HYPH|nr:hypothetical protein [Devosia limi]KKB85957.1 hypothetical protein VW29_04965 [Devosia limi DSM 17137]SHF00541.1 hypothetical protein SAMN02745223_01543 [Devosia limi DSM 17137]
MRKSRQFSLLALALVPGLLVGALLWFLVGLVPECGNNVTQTVAAPDGSRQLVVFSGACGANTEAAILPVGQALANDATGFLSVEGNHDLDPRWDGFGNLELTLPPDAQIHRQDQPAGVTIIYR